MEALARERERRGWRPALLGRVLADSGRSRSSSSRVCLAAALLGYKIDSTEKQKMGGGKK